MVGAQLACVRHASPVPAAAVAVTTARCASAAPKRGAKNAWPGFKHLPQKRPPKFKMSTPTNKKTRYVTNKRTVHNVVLSSAAGAGLP